MLLGFILFVLGTNICIIIYEYGLLVSAKKTICDAKSTATGYMEKNLVKNSHLPTDVYATTTTPGLLFHIPAQCKQS